MIKFFRHIRKKLLEENRFTKYLLYALGEILLVVIGILIALQINNWNEAEKLQKVEISLLKELRSAIEQDTFSVMSYLSIIEMAETGIKEINKAFETKQFSDSLNNSFGQSMFRTSWEGTTAPYETLKSQGLSIISNDTLRKKLIRLYERTYPFIKESEKNHFMDDAYFKNYCSKLFDNIAFAAKVENGFKPRAIKPHDIDALSKDKEYMTLLNTRLSEIEFLKYFVMEGLTRNSLKSLLEIIDRELKRLSR